MLLLCVLAYVCAQQCTLFGREALYRGPQMNFCGCVLNFISFHVFTCDDHGDPLPLSFWSNCGSVMVSFLCTIPLWLLSVALGLSLCSEINPLCHFGQFLLIVNLVM